MLNSGPSLSEKDPPESRHQPLPLQDRSARRNLPRSWRQRGRTLFTVYRNLRCLSSESAGPAAGRRRDAQNAGLYPEAGVFFLCLIARHRAYKGRDFFFGTWTADDFRHRATGNKNTRLSTDRGRQLSSYGPSFDEEKAFFPARFEPGATVPPPRILPLKKVKCPILRRQKKRPILHAWANISTTLQVIYLHWRRGRDSNSWYAFNVHTISNRAPSTNSDTSPC